MRSVECDGERVRNEDDDAVKEARAVLLTTMQHQAEQELRDVARAEGWTQQVLEESLVRLTEQEPGLPVSHFVLSAVLALIAAAIGGLLRPLIL